MDHDHPMDDAATSLFVAVSTPRREEYDAAREKTAKAKKKIQDLEAELVAAKEQTRENFERTAASMVEAQKQLMAQNEAIERLTRDVVYRTNETIDLKVQLRVPSGPGLVAPRKGRGAKYPVLRNTSDTARIPLDPEPLPATAAPSAESLSPLQIKTTITKKMTKGKSGQLRETVYENFGVTKQADFMTHVPVSRQRMEAAVVPLENEWLWDFSRGIGGDERGGRPRAVAYLIAQHGRKKSNSSKHRKYVVRVLTISLTIEIKIAEGAVDVGTWQRLLEIVDKLKAVGMSSEEEDDTEYEGQPMTLYRVKICVWRARAIADYLRLVDKQTDAFEKQHCGIYKALRAPTDDIGKSAAPKGLPECMYNGEWLNTLGPLQYEDLEVSEEAFALLVAATSRMV
ncbi:hypothetical protein B0H13DRAFT_2366449 [Mycena leptocephala]|nr:hypothetical protein B0H13DRAFT_2366449 [Mycena leptocephala]